MTESVEGLHRCGSCLQWVGTQPALHHTEVVRTRPYKHWRGDDGQEHYFCVDREACDRRWQDVKDGERFAAAEARIYFPEPEDDR